MKQTRITMGMPVTVEVVDAAATADIFETVFAYFAYVDATFSTYKAESEISRLNRGELTLERASRDVQTIFTLAESTKRATDGYFDMWRNGACDPSGIVKGWAILNAAELIRGNDFANYYVDAGGDIQMAGTNAQGQPWRVGIQNPFNPQEIVKVLSLTDHGVATSGTYVRGQHIYNPKQGGPFVSEIVSLTVIGPDIYQADRFATAAFAMGAAGISFIENLDGFEGYMIDQNGLATYTTNFERHVLHEVY